MAPTIDHLLPYTATLITRTYDGAPDEYGNPTWQEASVVGATRCELQQVGTREDKDGALELTLWRTFLPPTAPVAGWDALRVEDGPHAGRTFELTGDAAPTAAARDGVVHHYEVTVQGER